MEEAHQSEKVDAIVTSSLRKTNNERIVEKFGSSDFYVIVKKGTIDYSPKQGRFQCVNSKVSSTIKVTLGINYVLFCLSLR